MKPFLAIKPYVFYNTCTVLLITLFCTITKTQAAENNKPLSFEFVVNTAQINDPWLKKSEFKQQSLEQLSEVATSHPDPKVSVSFANLPTDSFSLSQENMTQFKVGVSQMFARGDSLKIKHKQLLLTAQQEPLQRQNREAQVRVIVGSLWLELYQVQQSILLIEKNSELFEQLSAVAEASYGSGYGKTRQQDIVRAQLEQTRLEDKLHQLLLTQDNLQGKLTQWLSQYQDNDDFNSQQITLQPLQPLQLSDSLPLFTLHNEALIQSKTAMTQTSLANLLVNHPSVKVFDKKILVSGENVSLAKQKSQPQWGVNASYGYRADNDMGQDRSDLFSVGVVFDMPLFGNNRQKNEVQSAISSSQIMKTEKVLQVRRLMSSFASDKGRLLRTQQRKVLYQEKLLPQIHEQAQVSLTAYTRDDGDFSEVVRARIAELNAQIDYLAIKVTEKKIMLALNYLFINGVSK